METRTVCAISGIPPLIIWAAMNLDFLCVHPFRDGNGRVSRLLLLLSLYQMGFMPRFSHVNKKSFEE